MSLASDLNVQANHLFLYYKDLAKAQKFYEEILGLKRVLDYGFASIHQISATTYVGLVDESRGMHKSTEPKTVTLSFITNEVDDWYQYLTKKGVQMHHPLADATRHPTRGFVALDSEGYFLEFETFLEDEQNIELKKQLKNTATIYPSKNQQTSRPTHLGVQGNIIWLYYEKLAPAQQFYEEILGFNLVIDQGFAKIHASSKSGFIGLVDGAQGLHPFTDEKAVTIAFFTNDVRHWLTHFKKQNIRLRSDSITVESEAVETFVAYDVGGYFLEFDQFLDHEWNRDILKSLKST